MTAEGPWAQVVALDRSGDRGRALAHAVLFIAPAAVSIPDRPIR